MIHVGSVELVSAKVASIGFGEVFGWLLIVAVVGTLLNYVIKFINKKFGKKITSSERGKNIMKVLMRLFVKSHRFFGMAAIVLLLVHLTIQFLTYGPNVTGGIAAMFLFLQAGLGMYAGATKKPRKGAWFIMHRSIAILILIAMIVHLVIPYSLNSLIPQKAESSSAQEVIASDDERLQGTEASDDVMVPDSSAGEATSEDSAVDEAVSNDELPVFTLDELSQYNGKDGNKAYVAYDGIVYDVTDVSAWNNGSHKGQYAGGDLTGIMDGAPHGTSKLEGLPVVGTLGE